MILLALSNSSFAIFLSSGVLPSSSFFLASSTFFFHTEKYSCIYVPPATLSAARQQLAIEKSIIC